MKKRPFSLIEVTISLGLLALLLSTLLFWHRSLSRDKEKFTKLKWPLMEERYAGQRLQHILPKAELPFFKSDLSESLVFIFDRGPFEDPLLSGKVLGRLYHDAATHALCLGIWPYPNKEETRHHPSQTLVLLNRISSCKFEFYNPPDPLKKIVDPEVVGLSNPNEGWQDLWKGDYNKLPALIKLTVTRDLQDELKEPFVYCFELPVPIIFPEDKE